jgi:hypothetical protein
LTSGEAEEMTQWWAGLGQISLAPSWGACEG